MSVDPGNAGADPTDPQTWNGYGYVRNSPLIYVDPDGENILGDIWNAITGAAGAAGNWFTGGGTQPTYCLSFGGLNCPSSGGGNDWQGGFGAGAFPYGGHGGLLFPITATGVADRNPQTVSTPPKSGTPAPNNREPPSACLIANINAVNAVSNLNVNLSNVVGQPFLFNGGLNVNFSVPGASPSQLPPGRYASSLLTKILGIGNSLHVPGPGGTDPSTYGVDPTSGNFTFTTHIDTAYSTWHTPIGALIHYFVDVRDKGAHRGPC